MPPRWNPRQCWQPAAACTGGCYRKASLLQVLGQSVRAMSCLWFSLIISLHPFKPPHSTHLPPKLVPEPCITRAQWCQTLYSRVFVWWWWWWWRGRGEEAGRIREVCKDSSSHILKTEFDTKAEKRHDERKVKINGCEAKWGCYW